MITKSNEYAFLEQTNWWYRSNPLVELFYIELGALAEISFSGFLAGVAIVLVQKQLSKGEDIELKSSLTSSPSSVNGTKDYESSYDEYYTEIEEIEIIETKKKDHSGSKMAKSDKGTESHIQILSPT